MSDSTRQKPTDGVVRVGWREAVQLPAWGLEDVRAKIDTGARTSALHVENVRDNDDGTVTFHAVLHRGAADHPEITAPIVRRSRVRSSTGEMQERYVVKTTLSVGPIERDVEISLVSRENMLCRMLVGRLALPPGVVVDPRRRYLHGRPRKRRKPTD